MILLDTNALLWVLGDPNQFGANSLRLLNEGDEVYSSPVSLFQELPLNHRRAEAVELFPELARHDPFDRLILAQAFVEGMTLLTADRVLISLGRPFVCDARS